MFTKDSIYKIIKNLFLVTLIYITYRYLGLSCPIKKYLHFPCPTCGVSHAIDELLKLNFAKSFEYNPLAIPFLLLFLYIIIKQSSNNYDKRSDEIVKYSAIILFIAYIIRIIRIKF